MIIGVLAVASSLCRPSSALPCAQLDIGARLAQILDSSRDPRTRSQAPARPLGPRPASTRTATPRTHTPEAQRIVRLAGVYGVDRCRIEALLASDTAIAGRQLR
jgi:hypothetical protein